MTDDKFTTVIKVGGSLFDLPDLADRLAILLRQLSGERVVFVSGGGAAADTVRELQPVHQLSDAAAHRIAMESLRVGEQLLFELLPNARFLKTADDCSTVAIARSPELIESAVLNDTLRPREDWSFTSDSIAALIAQIVGAEKLILLKSISAPTREELQSSNKVDAAFLQYAEGLK
ncbi:MAG: hypothetical protein AB8G99_14355, partial [Planctomycetaceae bacterium]